MTSKIEARRFSGKPGTWPHYDMAVKAHFRIQDLLEFLNDGTGVPADKRADWKKGQQKVFSHFILTCDDRAATTLLSIDADKDDAGWAAYVALRDKHGDHKEQGLSKQTKKFFKRKQKAKESTADYLNDMRARITGIERACR